MRNIALFCIVCLVLIGIVSASGMVPAERTVRNSSTVIIPVKNTETPVDTGFVQSIISPVARYIGINTTAPAAESRSPVMNSPANPQVPAPTQGVPTKTGMSLAQQIVDMHVQESGNVQTTDPCTMDNSNFRVMHGTVHILYVQEHPVRTTEGVILEDDGKLYGILSENPEVFSLMQTAVAAGKPVLVAAYYDPADVKNNYIPLFNAYRACWIAIDNS
jgi:hypothetical protein